MRILPRASAVFVARSEAAFLCTVERRKKAQTAKLGYSTAIKPVEEAADSAF
jgi:hypothetical protein